MMFEGTSLNFLAVGYFCAEEASPIPPLPLTQTGDLYRSSLLTLRITEHAFTCEGCRDTEPVPAVSSFFALK